jgi:probable HAF family extracellular repeat protein
VRRSLLLALAGIAVVFVVSAAARPAGSVLQARWVITDLGTLGGRYSEALAVNDRGQVVGYSEVMGGGYHVFLWQNGVMRDLGPLEGEKVYSARDEYLYSDPTGVTINRRGQVLWNGPDGSARLWANSTVRRLPLRVFISWQRGSGLNNKGQAVGSVKTTRKDADGKVIGRAAKWENGKLILLGSLTHDNYAALINNHGQITVQSNDWSDTRAFLWDNGRMVSLGERPIMGMNDLGQIIFANAPGHGLMWQRGRVRDLGPILPGDINNLGQVAGGSPNADSAASEALLWEDGTLNQLDTLGGRWADAQYINDQGHVLGESVTPNGKPHIVVWQEGVVTDVGSGSSTGAVANAINKKDEIVGCAITGKPRQMRDRFGDPVDTPCGSGSRREDGSYTPPPFHAVLWTLRSD